MKKRILAVSGGADSVYLLHRYGIDGGNTLVAHVNHGARGRESDEDMRFVEAIANNYNLPVRVKRMPKKGAAGSIGPAFEERARNIRYAFLKELRAASGAGKILLAHTADDQVETVLMRIMEGAGISGLKGIPRKTADGIERPMLDTWREEILACLRKDIIPYRVDKSNFDTRFERAWVRHVLIPLLEKRYGKPVKKRIFALGERFREIDMFLEDAARRWKKRNVNGPVNGERTEAVRGESIGGGGLRFRRKPFGKLPAALRKKILQVVCFERVGISPNERLLESMDRLIVSGGASARINVGKGATLRCSYEEAVLDIPAAGMRRSKMGNATPDARDGKTASGGKSYPLKMHGPGKYEFRGASIFWEEKKRVPLSGLKRLAKGERVAVFDRGDIIPPLSVRPLRAGDRIRPFGLTAEKKVKDVLIDRKVPREERWGRPVVCDADDRILWIPGVVRSVLAPITVNTRRVVLLRLEFRDITGNNRKLKK